MAKVPLNDFQSRSPFRRVLIAITIPLFQIAAVVVVILFGVGVVVWFWHSVSAPVDVAPSQLFTIDEGEDVHVISQNLFSQGLITGKWSFETYVYLDGSETRFKAGTYDIASSVSIRDLVKLFTSGDISRERRVTILEGWTSRQIAAYLEEEGVVAADEFLLAVQTGDSRKIIPDKVYPFLADKPTDQGLEGYLFPDTYRIYRDARADQMIERMLDNFGEKFTPELKQGFSAQGLSVFEGVTLASIVEKEVRTAEDRKIAAGIFLSRIKLGIPLQSDATVNYVTGKQALQPTQNDVETDSPYNTYKVKGLPPGPISNPSLAALEAVAEPTETDYLYFLTTPDGSTVFSKTYEEHLANKRKYLQ